MDKKMGELFDNLKSNNEKGVINVVNAILKESQDNVIELPSRHDSRLMDLNLYHLLNAMVNTIGLSETESKLEDYLERVRILKNQRK